MPNDIAIVIPLFNKELSVKRAIASVLSQTVSFKELIIVDDGSTDSSLQIVKQFKDSRIKIISQENQGVSIARNNGVIATEATYICFLDADDEWQPHFLEEIIKLIKLNSTAGIFCTRYKEVDEKGKSYVGKLVNINNAFCGQLADFFTAYLENRSLICSSNICINKQYFLQVGGYPAQAKIGEDIYLWLRIALMAPVMFSTKTSCIVYRNAENRSNVRVKLAIPYHISYFFHAEQKKLLRENKTLKAFLLYNATIFGLYASQMNNNKLAVKTANLLFKYNFLYGTIVIFSVLLPKCCIKLLKKLRNKKTLSYEN